MRSLAHKYYTLLHKWGALYERKFTLCNSNIAIKNWIQLAQYVEEGDCLSQKKFDLCEA